MIPWLSATILSLAQGAEVRVLKADGQPAAEARLRLRVGLARFALAEDFERWSALEKLEGVTDAEGRASFARTDAGERWTVFARLGTSTALAEGGPEAPLELRLEPTGELTGKISSRQSLRGWTLRARAARGGQTKDLELGSEEEWTLADLPSGEVELELRQANWLALRRTVTVVAGKKTKVPTLKVGEEFLLGADPLVDAHEIRLVDAEKKPVAGRKMAWSAPHMDGWIASNEEGEILMAGGGVAIGPPPFVLRLASVGVDQEARFLVRSSA